MNEVEFILKELQKGHAGDPWHGPSRASVLGDVTMDEAARRPGAERDAPSGSGVTHREMLHGLAQHDAYHTGQCSILKRLYRGAYARAR